MPKRGYELVNAKPAWMKTSSAKRRKIVVARRPSASVSTQVKRALLNQRTGGFLGLEKKFKDFEYDAVISASIAGSEADPATALSLTAIEQGDGEQQREGRKCTVQSVQMRGKVVFVSADSTTIATGGFVRLLLVQDKQSNAAQFNAEDVLVDPTDTDLDSVTPRNLQYTQRFKVLVDKTIRCPQKPAVFDADSVLSGQWEVPFSIYKKINILQNFNGTANPPTIAQQIDNSVHLIAISSNGTQNLLRYFSRVRFMG